MYLNIEMKKATSSGINVLHLFCSFLIFFTLEIHAQFDFFGQNHVPDFVSSTKDQILELRTHLYPQQGLKEQDKITKLPGQPSDVDFDQYSGYVTVNVKNERALFYYFAEADRSIKDSLPLILWFNGGPGCSSLGIGALMEVGPFRLRSDGKTLFENEYAWNKVGNLLFIESPVGVGFSYSNTSSDLDKESYSDRATADDVYVFVLNWLERFPEYKHRDVFITGESYAGHYIPQLADTFMQHNKYAANKDAIINLKGIAAGNAVWDTESEYVGRYRYFLQRGFINETLFETIRKNCNDSMNLFNNPRACFDPVGVANVHIPTTTLDEYFIYYPICNVEHPERLTKEPKDSVITQFDECSADFVEHYLNQPDVQSALHANVTNIPYPWSQCGNKANYSPKNTVTASNKPLVENLLKNNVRVLAFSGDSDGIVPITQTKEFITRLNRTEVVPYTHWNVGDEIAGASIIYEGGFTFVTVVGAGHMVPSYQPERALVLIKHFIENKPLPGF